MKNAPGYFCPPDSRSKETTIAPCFTKEVAPVKPERIREKKKLTSQKKKEFGATIPTFPKGGNGNGRCAEEETEKIRQDLPVAISIGGNCSSKQKERIFSQEKHPAAPPPMLGREKFLRDSDTLRLARRRKVGE